MRSVQNHAKRAHKRDAATEHGSKGFTDEERAAKRARRQELRHGGKEDGESAVRAARTWSGQ